MGTGTTSTGTAPQLDNRNLYPVFREMKGTGGYPEDSEEFSYVVSRFGAFLQFPENARIRQLMALDSTQGFFTRQCFRLFMEREDVLNDAAYHGWARQRAQEIIEERDPSARYILWSIFLERYNDLIDEIYTELGELPNTSSMKLASGRLEIITNEIRRIGENLRDKIAKGQSARFEDAIITTQASAAGNLEDLVSGVVESAESIIRDPNPRRRSKINLLQEFAQVLAEHNNPFGWVRRTAAQLLGMGRVSGMTVQTPPSEDTPAVKPKSARLLRKVLDELFLFFASYGRRNGTVELEFSWGGMVEHEVGQLVLTAGNVYPWELAEDKTWLEQSRRINAMLDRMGAKLETSSTSVTQLSTVRIGLNIPIVISVPRGPSQNGTPGQSGMPPSGGIGMQRKGAAWGTAPIPIQGGFALFGARTSGSPAASFLRQPSALAGNFF